MGSVKAITISRQLGSGGDEIAALLAARLGWRCLGRDLIDQAARASGAPEAALAALDELNLLGLKPSDEDQQAYHRAIKKIITEAAEQGGVIIIGRGGQAVLAQHPHVFHIKIVAPTEKRVCRLMARERIHEEAAVNRIATSDRSRASYMRKSYGVEWLDPLLYDIVINTSSDDLNGAAEILLLAVEKKV